jgi:hypothetical protein
MQAQTKSEFVLNLKIAEPRLCIFVVASACADEAIESGLLTSDYGTELTCRAY